jgi:hypothetical protein
LIIYNSLSCSLCEANMDESLPCSSVVGHGCTVIKCVKSAISVLAMSTRKPPSGV